MAAEKCKEMNMPMESPPMNSGDVGSCDHLAKKKRRRPRTTEVVAPPVMSDPAAAPVINSQGRSRGRPRGSRNRQILASSDSAAAPVNNSADRTQGRPRDSGNLQILASPDSVADSVATCLRACTIDVYAGEEMTQKILSLAQGGPRGLCVLSAKGSISQVALRQPSGGVIYHEGQFQILSLAGLFTFTEVGGVRSRTGGFTVLLAGPHGQIGGEVAGPVVAASLIQAVIGSF